MPTDKWIAQTDKWTAPTDKWAAFPGSPGRFLDIVADFFHAFADFFGVVFGIFDDSLGGVPATARADEGDACDHHPCQFEGLGFHGFVGLVYWGLKHRMKRAPLQIQSLFFLVTSSAKREFWPRREDQSSD